MLTRCYYFSENASYVLFLACSYPPGMQRRSDVSFLPHLGWDVADHIETLSQRHYWYVNETDLFRVLPQRISST